MDAAHAGGVRTSSGMARATTLMRALEGAALTREEWRWMLVVAAASCWVVGVSRKSKNFHETVRVATKWTLRCVAVALLHNAFKAPAAQFVVYLVLIALYARTRILKMTGKKTYYREGKTE